MEKTINTLKELLKAFKTHGNSDLNNIPVDTAISMLENAIEELNTKFPNGFTVYIETFHEVVKFITEHNTGETVEERGTTVYNIQSNEGMWGLTELAKQWTNEFETKNKGREWDGEFIDEIQAFCEDKNRV